MIYLSSKQWQTLLVIAAITVVVIAWMLVRTDWDSRAIHRQLSELAELVEKNGPESTFDSLGRARSAGAFFFDGAVVEYLPGKSLSMGRDSSGPAFLAARERIETASVRLGRHDIQIRPDGASAESNVTARAQVVLAGGQVRSDSLEYRILWEKSEGDWRIRRVAVLGPN